MGRTLDDPCTVHVLLALPCHACDTWQDTVRSRECGQAAGTAQGAVTQPQSNPKDTSPPPRSNARHHSLGVKYVGAKREAVALHGPLYVLPASNAPTLTSPTPTTTPPTQHRSTSPSPAAPSPHQARNPPPPDRSSASVSLRWRRVPAPAACFDPPWRDRVSRPVVVRSPSFSGSTSGCAGVSGRASRTRTRLYPCHLPLPLLLQSQLASPSRTVWVRRRQHHHGRRQVRQ